MLKKSTIEHGIEYTMSLIDVEYEPTREAFLRGMIAAYETVLER